MCDGRKTLREILDVLLQAFIRTLNRKRTLDHTCLSVQDNLVNIACIAENRQSRILEIDRAALSTHRLRINRN